MALCASWSRQTCGPKWSPPNNTRLRSMPWDWPMRCPWAMKSAPCMPVYPPNWLTWLLVASTSSGRCLDWANNKDARSTWGWAEHTDGVQATPALRLRWLISRRYCMAAFLSLRVESRRATMTMARTPPLSPHGAARAGLGSLVARKTRATGADDRGRRLGMRSRAPPNTMPSRPMGDCTVCSNSPRHSQSYIRHMPYYRCAARRHQALELAIVVLRNVWAVGDVALRRRVIDQRGGGGPLLGFAAQAKGRGLHEGHGKISNGELRYSLRCAAPARNGHNPMDMVGNRPQHPFPRKSKACPPPKKCCSCALGCATRASSVRSHRLAARWQR